MTSEAPDKVLNEAQRYKTQQWLEKDILKLGSVDGKANIILVGTCLHPEALLPTLLQTAGWQGRKYQAVLRFAKEETLWVEWQKLYTDRTNPNREVDSDAFYEAHKEARLEGTEVLWPEAETYLMLMKMRVLEGQASFQSEKQNDPYDPTRQMFVMKKAVRFKLEYETDGHTIVGMRWQDGSNRFVRYEDLVQTVAFHDPAIADSKESHYAAIVVCAQDSHGYLYCLDAYIEKVQPSRQIEQAFAMHEKWNFDKLCVETNNFQGLFKELYEAYQKEDTTLRVKELTQHHDKDKLISTLEPLITNGQLDLSPVSGSI